MNDFLRMLQTASLMIASENELEGVLEQIVESARNTVGARYAALGVADDSGRLTAFIHSGMRQKMVDEIGALPQGHGLLGAIVQEQKTVRIPQIDADSRSVGFPPNHPPMSSFLGVPLVVEGISVGNLYLTDKIGAREFSEEDQKLTEMIASHAALAITKARLMEEAEQRVGQLEAINRASIAIAEQLHLSQTLQQIVDEARELVGAQYAALGIPNANGQLDEFIHSGMPSEIVRKIGHLPEGHGLLGVIIRDRKSFRLPRIGDDPESVGFPADHPPMDSFLGVPIIAGDAVLGSLYFTNKQGAESFLLNDQIVVETFAANAAVAIKNARLYERVQELAVSDERGRLGMDLHDGVIQSLYGIGLTLEAAEEMVKDGEDKEKIGEQLAVAMAGLKHAVQDIRNFIMDLKPMQFDGNLVTGIGRLVRVFQANTMIETAFDHAEALPDLPAGVARDFFLTTQESLANIARHAHASHVWITLRLEETHLVLMMRDNGDGFDMGESGRRIGHGLTNMTSRATARGGIFDIQSEIGNGTEITFKLPV